MSALEAWSETVKLIISSKISNLEHRSFRPCHKILEDPHIKAYLTELLSKYVLVPEDKAGSNIIFVCKYYYVHTLMEELGINSRTNCNSTYVTQDRTVDDIIQTHATTLGMCLTPNYDRRRKACHRYIGFLDFTRHRTRQDLLQVQVHALQRTRLSKLE